VLLVAGCVDEPAAIVDTGPAPAECAPLDLTLAQEWPRESLPRVHDAEGTQMGVALGDLDGDDWLDLLFAYGGGSMAFRNQQGVLVEEPAFSVSGAAIPWGQAVALADLDGDVDLDAYLGRWEGEADKILWNDGSGGFTAEPLPGAPGTVYTGTFGDADNDGDLDLYVARAATDMSFDDIAAGEQVGDPNVLYLLGEDGRYTDATERLPPDTLNGLTFQGAWLDADNDGDQDLYVANDGGPWVDPNHLLLNDGTGWFTEKEDCACDIAMYSMGVAVGDPDEDGDPDLYITDVGGPNYLVNDGDGRFVDATLATGAAIPGTATSMTSWGTSFVDLDLDRDMDLVVTFGRSGKNFEASDVPGEDGDEQPDVVLLNNGDGTFVQATGLGYADPERTRAVAVGDINRDGRPDLVTTGKHFLKVWLGEGGCATGLTVRVDAGGRNRSGLGSRVEVEVAGRVTTQWMLPGVTGSSNAPELYFGLGGYPAADRVTVTWPDGERAVIEDVSAGATLDLVHP
jgi:hypothetical protein